MLADAVYQEVAQGIPQRAFNRDWIQTVAGRGDMSYGLKRYQQSRTEMASRGDILIMLYEGAIRFLEQSIQEFEGKKGFDYMARHKTLLRKGRAIIEEFQNTLDFDAGGEISFQLNDLYIFMLDSLTQANITRDISYIRRVINLLSTLLDGWRGAVAVTKDK